MFYVYVLKSIKDGKLYIGLTQDLKNRYREHQNGEVFATKGRRPLDLIFYEAFKSREQAIQREHYFKTKKGKIALSKILK